MTITGIKRERLHIKLHKYTEQQLFEADTNSTSMRQVLLKLDVAPYGGKYDILRKALQHYCLNTSHFTGQAWNKGKNLPSRIATEQYLNNELPIQSYKLKKGF